MEFRLFQEEATTTVVLQSSDGDWVEVRSFSRPLADWCESEPFRGTCRDIQVDRSDMQVTAGLGAELARYEVTVGAQEFVIASQTELSPATFRSLIDVLDLVDVDEWLAAYQSSL